MMNHLVITWVTPYLGVKSRDIDQIGPGYWFSSILFYWVGISSCFILDIFAFFRFHLSISTIFGWRTR
jgi:hypothetical protein